MKNLHKIISTLFHYFCKEEVRRYKQKGWKEAKKYKPPKDGTQFICLEFHDKYGTTNGFSIYTGKFHTKHQKWVLLQADQNGHDLLINQEHSFPFQLWSDAPVCEIEPSLGMHISLINATHDTA